MYITDRSPVMMGTRRVALSGSGPSPLDDGVDRAPGPSVFGIPGSIAPRRGVDGVAFSPRDIQDAAGEAGPHRGRVVTATRVSGLGTLARVRASAPSVEMSVWRHGTSARAVAEARAFMHEVLGSLRAANVRLLEGIDVQLHVIPHGTRLTDMLEFGWLKGTTGPDGHGYDDLRGMGGAQFGRSILYAVGEEHLVPVPGKPSGYDRGFIPSHEAGHVVEQFALTTMQRKRLQAAYRARHDAKGPWLNPGPYTSSLPAEYFAQSTAAYFGHPFGPRAVDQATYTRAWLKKNDHPMYGLLRDVYGSHPAGGSTAVSGLLGPPARTGCACHLM